jgi:hypothetical protein
MMHVRTLCLALALLAPAAAAGARDDDIASSAQALFHDGRFLDAAEAAGGDWSSADDQALAAKSYAIAAFLTDDKDEADRLAKEARVHAETAIALNPRHVEGRLQLAVALWLSCRYRDGFQSYLDGAPQRGRQLIESAISDAPDEPWGYALLGSWHFEALRRGGDMAKRMLGADLAAGANALDRAQSLAPGDPGIAVQAGLAYLALDPKRYHDQAKLILERAVAIPPRDGFEAAIETRARTALALMQSNDKAALQGAIDRWFGGGEDPDAAGQRKSGRG